MKVRVTTKITPLITLEKQLNILFKDMDNVSTYMYNMTGTSKKLFFKELRKHSRELKGASKIVKNWAMELEKIRKEQKENK